jgi:hypothetical protein
MNTKQKPPPDDPAQSVRFAEAARAIGVVSGRAFAKVFKKIVPKKRLKKR